MSSRDFPATAILGYLIIPTWGWRPMFIIAGIGSLIVWYLRKNLPESPRWLEAQGRTAEAEALMQNNRKGSGGWRYAAGACCYRRRRHSSPPLRCSGRRSCNGCLVGSWVLITINTLIFGFVIFLPQFFLRQGLTITNSLGYTVVLACASLVGCAFGACLVRLYRTALEHHRRVFLTIAAGWVYAHFSAASDPVIVLSVGAILIVAIYIQTAILFGVYTPELFPTEIRLRANGICNTLGRGATVVSPFVVGSLMVNYQLPGVIWLMIGLVVVQIVAV